jgi:glycosyltransferase involved in cell wall biosynthesis
MTTKIKHRLCVIVDCQVLQTSDRKRGMGFYLQSLLLNVASHEKAAEFDWVFIVNSRLNNLTQADKAVLQEYKGQLLAVPLLHQGDRPLFNEAASFNQDKIDTVSEKFLADREYDQTLFFIPAMFCREIYPVYPSKGTANLMLFHDLIPFLYHKQYFADHEGLPRIDYAQRFREVYRTDRFVTNSQTTADDLMVYLGFDPARLTPIYGAPADRRKLSPVAPSFADKLVNGFVFLSSGDDFRKNNDLAVQAFASLGTGLKLVVTSNFSKQSKQKLSSIYPNIIFAGSVTDGEYLWLLHNAGAVYFPSLYEGLGLPLLEAVECGAKIVCSKTPVFMEISPNSFYYFEPNSAASMVRALKQALTRDNAALRAWAEKKAQYQKILNTFTWDKTATRFLEAITHTYPAPKRLSLAVLCPSPASYSAIGKYVLEVHAELSRHYDLTYFVEDGHTIFEPTRPNLLEFAANYAPVGSFTKAMARKFDYVLYHIGNSEFHVETILNAMRIPANVIVHDSRLKGVFDFMQMRHYLTPERVEFEARLNKIFDCHKSEYLVSICSWQHAVFCHSAFAHDAIAEAVSVKNERRSHKTALPIGVPDIQLRSDDETIISFAGIISESKGINLVTEVSKLPLVRVKVFGYGVLGDSRLLQEHTNIEVVKDLTDKEFQDALKSSNIVISYRTIYNGETSKSVLEAMRYGAVAIVRRIGWFDELPDDAVMKVDNEQELIEAVKYLVRKPSAIKEIGDAARAYIRRNHSYKNYVENIKASLEK